MKKTTLDNLPDLGVSHNPAVKKRVFIAKGEIPQLTNFSRAIFKPGQHTATHRHETMFEATAGDCMTIEPGEPHGQRNPFDAECVMLYFGIAADG